MILLKNQDGPILDKNISDLLNPEIIYNTRNRGPSHASALSDGQRLHDIINKARAISLHELATDEFHSFRWISITSIGVIAVALISFVYWVLCFRGGGGALSTN